MPRRSAAPALLALAIAAPLAAQAPTEPRRQRSDSVPRELVQALLPNSDGLRVGEPAGDLPRELLPPNGLVLGSVEYGGTSTTLVVMMQPEHEAIDAFEARATAAGWTQPPANAAPSFVDDRHTRGFVTSESSVRVSSSMGPMGVGGTRGTSSRPLCKGDAIVTATSSPWSGGRTLLRVQAMRAVDYSPCRPNDATGEARLMRSVTVYDSIVPALQPPPRAQVRWAGGGSTSGEWETRATIETSLSASDLLAHYAAEMRREGWTPLGEGAATPSVSLQAWSRTSATGQLWHATTIFSARPDRGYRAELRMERARTR